MDRKPRKDCSLCGVVGDAKVYWTGTEYKLKLVVCKNPMCIGNRMDLK